MSNLTSKERCVDPECDFCAWNEALAMRDKEHLTSKDLCIRGRSWCEGPTGQQRCMECEGMKTSTNGQYTMTTEQLPSKQRPSRDSYPLDMAGDLQFHRALCAWQYDEIERLQRQVRGERVAKAVDEARAAVEPIAPASKQAVVEVAKDGDRWALQLIRDHLPPWPLAYSPDPIVVRAAEPPSALPDGFPAISDECLQEHIEATQSKTLQSALLELQMRRGASTKEARHAALDGLVAEGQARGEYETSAPQPLTRPCARCKKPIPITDARTLTATVAYCSIDCAD